MMFCVALVAAANRKAEASNLIPQDEWSEMAYNVAVDVGAR